MPLTNILQETSRLEIQAYERPQDVRNLRHSHVSFSGAPYKHFFDPEKIILIVDPYSSNNFYYEFRADDVDYLEELSNVVTPEGEAIAMVRVWVKKGCVGLRCTPFRVDDFMRR